MATFVNTTKLTAEWFPLIDKEGRNVATVIAKATYDVTASGLVLAPRPLPLYLEDECDMLGDRRVVRLASDLATYKPATDVLIARPPGELRRHPVLGRKLQLRIGDLKVSGTAGDDWPFGPLARDASPRREFAGTYDAAWAAERMPLLPRDFDDRFHQAAPSRQIVQPFLRGDEPLSVRGVAEGEPEVVTRLPGRIVLVAGNAWGQHFTRAASLDTVVLHLDPLRLELVWRLSIHTRRSIEEVRYLFVYYPTLRSYQEVYELT
jgi:hypothetical protein